MKGSFVVCFFFLFSSTTGTSVALNDRPIIGILSQELSPSMSRYYPDQNYTSYIAASYVKFLEAAGARVVPILIKQRRSYYKELFASVNGVLFPGGSASLRTSGYGKAGKVLYDLAQQANQRGDYFPVWGTCLGYEFISYLAAGSKILLLSSCNSYNEALPLTLEEGALNSKLLSPMPADILDDLVNQSVTVNFHHKCVTKKNFKDFGVDKKMRILSTNIDSNGIEFISAVEGIDAPIYGVQFHPEKNIFEWNTKGNNIPHFRAAIRVSQYFANFFVDEARKSNHAFSSVKKETDALIYNYKTTFTGQRGSTFEECYFFSK